MKLSEETIALRLATSNDIAELEELISASVRGLQHEYTEAQKEAALGTVFGVDTQLIEDGTYSVAIWHSGNGQEVMAGCGGWSKRKTLFGSDHGPNRTSELLDPAIDAAKIRAFFVHPQWARRGIGTLMLDACEKAAYEAGFRRFEMGATLSGVPMYAARGYKEIERIWVPLKNSESLEVVRMTKEVA